MGQVGVLSNMIKRNWMPVVQAQKVSYLKPINPFQRFVLSTRFSFWDDKYRYTAHKFFAADWLCAVLQVRGAGLLPLISPGVVLGFPKRGELDVGAYSASTLQ